MDQIPEKLVIGAIGSVLGALIVYLGQTGFQITKKARQQSLEAREKETDEWKSMKMGVRQGITNYYLFSILRYLFLGNLLWIVPEFVAEPGQMLGMPYSIYICILVLGRGGALLCFFIGLGRILRYLRLRTLDGTLDDKAEK